MMFELKIVKGGLIKRHAINEARPCFVFVVFFKIK